MTSSRRAFTLIEMSIVLLVLSILAGMALAKMAQDARRAKEAEMQRKLDSIEAALFAFAKTNARLPCPADGARVRGVDALFGVEADTPGSCVDGATLGVIAPFDDGADTVGGILPVRALTSFGIKDDDFLDPYGHAFTYIVSRTATTPSMLTIFAPTSPLGNITIQDATGANRTTNATVLVLSHGSNGHGAFQLSGLRYNGYSSNVSEQLNCHCDGNAVDTGFTNIFALFPAVVDDADIENNFDDTGRYYRRSFFHW